MALEPVVFAPGLEGLIRAVTPNATPELWGAMRAAGFDHDKPVQSAYPVKVWLDCLELAVRTCHPELTRAAALERLGAAAIDGFQKTLVGGATFQFLRVIGVRRALTRITRSFRSGNNFAEFELFGGEPGRAEIAARGMYGVAPHFLGMIVAGALGAGATDAQGSITKDDGDAARFVLSWREG
jgi:uncharacterized protein (TIGR02265 family)